MAGTQKANAEEENPEAPSALSRRYAADLRRLLMAFCYLTGELTPDDAAAFEQRLADDQTVREAVCRMAALRDKLVTASGRTDQPVSLREVTSASRLGRQTSRLGRVSAAAVWAACGAAAASLCFVLADFGRPAQTAQPPGRPGALTARPMPRVASPCEVSSDSTM